MDLRGIKAMMGEIAPVIREYVALATKPMTAEILDMAQKIAAIDARQIQHGKDGEPGRAGIDGKSVTLEDVAPLINETVTKAVAAIPPAKDGEPGRDGKDGDTGQPGKDGLDGAPGLNGADGKDGLAGRDGIDGKDGSPGRDGEKGINGKDGIGLAGSLIDNGGELVVTMTDGRAVKLGRVNGHDGKDGAPGLDGFGFDDLEMLHDGAREFKFAFTRGEQRKEFAFTVPAMIYRGIFKEDEGYKRGDVVTLAGSVWHCQEDTNERPGAGSKAWTLAVKEGREGRRGKDGLPGKPGEQGKAGVPGRDGRWQ